MKKHIETSCVQEGYVPENGESRIAPLVQATTFKYDSAEDVAALFDLEKEGFFYSRLANPTVDVLEQKITALEGGVAAVGTSSGQAAITLTIATLCRAGDNIVAAQNLYGGTMNLFGHTLKRLGVEVRFVPVNATKEELEEQIDDKTKGIYGETIGNPGVEVLDFELFSAVAKKNDLPLIVDSTFATPVLCRPFQWGANIIIHSSTKYLDGHGTSVGGLIVDGGNFDWSSGRFPDFTEPDETYHGLSFYETFKEAAFAVKARTTILRDIGCTMAPMNAWLTTLGMETLALRMEKHSKNALALGKFLESRKEVSWIKYPGLEKDPYHELSKKYLPKGQSGVISFGLKNREQATKFIDSLKLIALVVHVADVRSCVLHPASMTHRQLSDEELKKAGIEPEQIRLSVGIEHVDDLIADLAQALDGVQ
ncbi:MAG: O-acetylhomoserine aminocarboxypropyltransferase/cysteine synthase [Tissierellia bacterium]|nr:O-acetylhomoserine aminocarboxypropyltransferase/cysteine synthase [Tissierellia bacterium]